MAMDQTGIMALPEADQAAMPTLSLEDSYDAAKSALQETSPELSANVSSLMQQIAADVQELSDEELDAMIDIVQQMHDNPEQYQELRAQLIADRQAEEDDFPPEYDPEFLAVALSILLEVKRSRSSTSAGPQGFAKGGIAGVAQALANKGRYGDTMLAHITPREARLLRKHGGSGVINPRTGLPEFGILSKAWKSVKNAVKKVLNNPIGKVVGTIALTAVLGPVVGATLAAPLASAGTTLLAGGNLKDAFKAAAFSYISGPSSPIGEFVSAPLARMGLEGTALQAATSGLLGTGAALLTGQKFSDAVKTGLMSSAMAVGTKMVSPQAQAPAPVEDMGTMARGPLAATAAEVAAQPAAQMPPASVAPVAQAAPGGDRMGEFISQPDQQERMANTPAIDRRAALPASAPNITAPTVAPPEAAKPASYLDTAKDWISKNIMPSGIQEQAIPQAQEAGAKAMEALKARVPTATPAMLEAAYQTAYKAAMPGMLSTYGPLTAAGIGALGMAGGFKAKPLESSPAAKEMKERLAKEQKMLDENPGMFTPKGFERFGAVYNDKGQIVDWKPWTPESAGAFTEYNLPRSIPMPNYGLASLMPQPARMASGGDPLYASLTANSTPAQIAAAYQEYVGSAGGADTAETRQAAQDYLSRLGVSSPTVESAYQTYKSAASAPAAAPVSAPAAAPKYLYELLSSGSTPLQIAAAYQQYADMSGGDISANQQTAIDYLTKLGVTQPTIQSAYDIYTGKPQGDMASLMARIDSLQQAIDLLSKPGGSTLSPGWNLAPGFSNYAESVKGTPIKATPSVLGSPVLGLTDPFAAGKISPLQYLVPQPYNTASMYGNVMKPPAPPTALAQGGIAGLAKGGYPRRTGQVSGPGTETSDSIPAMLSDGEFVMTAKAVRGAGGGDRREGARKMYSLMHRLEKNAARG